MEHSEQPKIEIRSTLEQKPFENPAVRSFFKEWCKTNDSIQPRLIPRDEWEVISAGGILRKRPDGNRVLIIPNDLQLWEMVGIMEAIDRDTFKDKPERQTQKKEEIISLGKMLQNTGIYISQRLGAIEEGKPIARALAEELYAYGQSLVEGKKSLEQEESAQNLSSQPITATEVEEVDRFLAGEQLYRSRQERAEKVASSDPLAKKEIYEEERRKTLRQFFRTTQKAFELEAKSKNGQLLPAKTDLKPWQSDAPIHSAFLKKIQKSLTQTVETPKRELDMAIFRRGLQSLVDEMKERGWKHAVNSFFGKLGINLPLEQRKLTEILDIDQLKTELEEVRNSKDLTKISAKEREIANKIQGAVSRFPYKKEAIRPAEMIANQYLNCVGRSTLGGALMEEAGLNYLVGGVPEHSILFLVTSDGRVEWRDMQSTAFNNELIDKEIVGKKQDGSAITVADIVAFSRNPEPQGLMFDIGSSGHRNKLEWVKEGQRRFVILLEAEYGQQIQILNSTGNTFLKLGYKKEALEIFQRTIALDPKYAYPYNGLGNALETLGRREEAIKAYRQAIVIDPEYADPYNGLGSTFFNLGRNKEAIGTLRQAIVIDPKEPRPYFNLGASLSQIGRNDEAIRAYRKFIKLADKQELKESIEKAKKKIVELQRK